MSPSLSLKLFLPAVESSIRIGVAGPTRPTPPKAAVLVVSNHHVAQHGDDTFPALALAMEPGDPDVMNEPPYNPQQAILSRKFLGSVFFYGVLITVSSIAGFAWALGRDPSHATTVCFMTLALAQIFHLGNARSVEAVVQPARVAANLYALGAVVLSIGLQLLSITCVRWPTCCASYGWIRVDRYLGSCRHTRGRWPGSQAVAGASLMTL